VLGQCIGLGWEPQLRTLGVIGGMSWVSTAMYYEQINKGVGRKLGGLSSAPLLMESMDFAVVARMQADGDWPQLADLLSTSAKRLERAGAEGLILACNTMHKLYPSIAKAVKIPVIHIGDVTADKLVEDGVRRAALLGTRFTMTDTFCRDRIEARDIVVTTPDPVMMAEIDRIIYEELGRGIVSRVSQRTLKTCLTMMGQARNQAVILGCTELVMLVDPLANVIPVYDTTALHAQAAVDFILGETSYGQQELPLAAAGGQRGG
jgi:aspartate racemase